MALASGDPASWKRWRRFDFGSLASMLLLETRHTGRTSNEAVTRGTLTSEMTAMFRQEGSPGPDLWHGSRLEEQLRAVRARVDAHRSAPEKRMMGDEQTVWFSRESARIAESGVPWRLVAQPLVMQEGMTPDLEGAVRAAIHRGELATARRWAAVLENLTRLNSTVPTTWGGVLTVTPELRDAALRKLAAGRYKITLNLDGWMGYEAARDRLAQALSAGKPVSTVVYGGDSHDAWVGPVRDSSGKAFAAEFDGMSVSSTGLESWVPWLPSDLHAAGWHAANPDLQWMDPSRRGFMLVRLNRTVHEVQFHAVDVSSTDTRTSELLAAFTAEPTGAGCPRVSAARAKPRRQSVGSGLRRRR
uniref:PhoD-like phosphatase metallophosphatase domain-containing protein n=1 Tax=Alexandrium catenella TaxID=2925 RepID=A0A7S1WD26_ALECA